MYEGRIFHFLQISWQGAFGEIKVVKWRGTTVAAKTILSHLTSDQKIVWVSYLSLHVIILYRGVSFTPVHKIRVNFEHFA